MAANITQVHGRGWYYLPWELWSMILERCIWHTHSEAARLAGTDQHQLAILSTVCRDWQDFFEGKLFQRLTLKTEVDIQTFAEIVQGGKRSAYVEWIWLCVELPMYDCQQCHHVESYEEHEFQTATFTKLVWSLFKVLSSWKIKDVRNQGITLELSANSPSDAHHFNKDLRFRLHDTAWDRWDNRPISPHNDPPHCWKDGKRIKKIPLDAKNRLFGHGLHFNYALPIVRSLGMRLPRVSVIMSLIIRRQFLRTFNAKGGLDPIIRSLTRLNSFMYEPWRVPTTWAQEWQDLHQAFLLREGLKARKRTLKKWAIFESHDEIFHKPAYSSSPQRRTADLLGAEFARSTHHLEELYVANKIDACDFFYAFHPQAPPQQKRWMVWKDLKKLSLTTQHLNPKYNSLVFLMAARAAERMPNLEIMELWSCWIRRCTAGIFRYRRGETEASIELVSTWPPEFTAETEAAWTRVATAQRPLPLRCKTRHWNPGSIDGDFDVLQQLELAPHMLHPVSLRQIAREDQRRREERFA